MAQELPHGSLPARWRRPSDEESPHSRLEEPNLKGAADVQAFLQVWRTPSGFGALLVGLFVAAGGRQNHGCFSSGKTLREAAATSAAAVAAAAQKYQWR